MDSPSHILRFEGVVVDELFNVTLRLRCADCGTVVESRLTELKP